MRRQEPVMPRKRRPAWIENPFAFVPFFDYAVVASAGPKGKRGTGKPPKPRRPDQTETTMAVGEEGQQPPPAPPGTTTPAMGEEGTDSVPTTTIARGEESQG
jgi:hypothetical protein